MSNEYKSFSKRYDYIESKSIQLEYMDDNLRSGLWNEVYKFFPDTKQPLENRPNPIFESIWGYFIKKPIDEYNSSIDLWHHLDSNYNKIFVKELYQQSKFNIVFDLIEFIIQNAEKFIGEQNKKDLIEQCNRVFERENSAYRIVKEIITPITSEEEIQSIENAANAPFDGVRNHIHQALALLSDRENPDYLNSIKESISAVESLANEVTGNSNGTLGQLTSDLNLHPAFSKGLRNLYGFTSDAKGIRHGGAGQPLETDQGTARFMLIICSAFVNYIIQQKTLQDRDN